MTRSFRRALASSPALLLLVLLPGRAESTCMMTCQYRFVDAACQLRDAAALSNPVFVTGTCETTCCAPGDCSPPTVSSIQVGDLDVAGEDGTGLLGVSFSEEKTQCEGYPVYRISSIPEGNHMLGMRTMQDSVYDAVALTVLPGGSDEDEACSLGPLSKPARSFGWPLLLLAAALFYRRRTWR